MFDNFDLILDRTRDLNDILPDRFDDNDSDLMLTIHRSQIIV
jgi:hypothetical protein